jgi:hypothetical protein
LVGVALDVEETGITRIMREAGSVSPHIFCRISMGRLEKVVVKTSEPIILSGAAKLRLKRPNNK